MYRCVSVELKLRGSDFELSVQSVGLEGPGSRVRISGIRVYSLGFMF